MRIRATSCKFLEATTLSEAVTSLSALDISVPPRGQGRTSDHTERYTVAHLLSCLAENNGLAFPLVLENRERPDFLLKMGQREIGIEHTEVVDEYDAWKNAVRQDGIGPEVYSLNPPRPRTSRTTRKELVKEIETNQSHGWVGNEAEAHWAQSVLQAIEKKARSMKKAGFERFKRNWLLIYADLRPPGSDRSEASSLLLSSAKKSEAMGSFDCIYIVSGAWICELSSQSFRILEGCDLWRRGSAESS